MYRPGVRVMYDLRQPNGQRVKDLRVRVNTSEYAEIEPETVYKVAVSSYLVRGGDGYQMIPEKMRSYMNMGTCIETKRDIWRRHVTLYSICGIEISSLLYSRLKEAAESNFGNSE